MSTSWSVSDASAATTCRVSPSKRNSLKRTPDTAAISGRSANASVSAGLNPMNPSVDRM